jgi:hypothetical protein
MLDRRLLPILLFFPLLVSMACKSGDKKEASDQPAKTTEGAAKAASGGEIFVSGKVALPAEVAGATFGAEKAAVFKATGADSTFMSSKAHENISYNFTFVDDKLDALSVSGKGPLEDTLTRAWGKPIKNKDGEAFWFDSAGGVRAWLPKYGDGEKVTFGAYQSIDALLGASGFDLAFAAGKPLLGATLDELKAAWGDALCDFDENAPRIKDAFIKNAADSLNSLRDVQRDLDLCQPGKRTVAVHMDTRDSIHVGLNEKAVTLVMSFPTGESKEIEQQLIGFLDKKLGEPADVLESDKTSERTYLDPAGKKRIVARILRQSVQLWVSDYLPLAELIGGEGPGLSVEGKGIIGKSFDDIKAADPEHFRASGELASLYYPPTKFGGQHTEIALERNAGAKKVHGYTVVLHHKDREAAGDEVFELLKAKFGEPKKDKRSTDTDLYYNFKKDGRKISARRVSQQWQLRVSK